MFYNPLLHRDKMGEIADNLSEPGKNEAATSEAVSLGPPQSFSKEGKPESNEVMKQKNRESAWSGPLPLWDRGKAKESEAARSAVRAEENVEVSYYPLLQQPDHFHPGKIFSPLSHGNTALSQEKFSLSKEDKTTSLIGQSVLNSDDQLVSTTKKKPGKLPPAFIRKKKIVRI
ncbi:hypothetical protein BGP_3488 [Beggiatoa sp. PS]|nr:hypothetical protein BGP_3488 [Beggiatoa sp. PS]